MSAEGEESAGALRVLLGVMYYLPFSVSAYAAARWKMDENLLQKGLYVSSPGRVLGFGPRDIHGYWTWKSTCAANVLLMLRVSRKVIVVNSEGMIGKDQW